MHVLSWAGSALLLHAAYSTVHYKASVCRLSYYHFYYEYYQY